MELKRKSKKSINRGVVFMQKNKKRAYPAFIREDEGIAGTVRLWRSNKEGGIDKKWFRLYEGLSYLGWCGFSTIWQSLIGPPKISLILLKILRCFIIQCTKNIVINRGNYENQIFACHLSKLCNIKGSHRVTPPVQSENIHLSRHMYYTIYLEKNASKNSNRITYLNGYLILYLW